MQNNLQHEAGNHDFTADDFKQEAERVISLGNKAAHSGSLFTINTAANWINLAKTRPEPKMLFGHFWFDGELCILFADTNLGKSILAVQIGNSISRGEGIKGFRLDTAAQPILYFDFELTDKQFETRYSAGYEQHYDFNDNFLRIEIDPDAEVPKDLTFEEYLSYSVERAIIQTGAKILIIDNLTYLRNETEKAKDALPLMKELKALKNRHGLSILALAHTPKRDLTKPITRNDLQGSKMLVSFTDSAFTIGESCADKNLRYLKQIKARNCEIEYDAENVCICHIAKPLNFLAFELLNYGKERAHLKELTEQDVEDFKARVMELNAAGKSLREIGCALGISHMKVSRILKEISKV